ncbi:MAG: hypothetical protein Q9160_003498 [Pyrenula sp. 1 TL-2023]
MTIWVDHSCRKTDDRKQNFDKSLREAQQFAKRASERLGGSIDQPTDANLEKLFKDQKQKAVDNAKRYFTATPKPGSGIANWKELTTNLGPADPNFAREQEANRIKSNIRIYCDNDPQETSGNSRWTLNRDLQPRDKGYDSNTPKQMNRKRQAPDAQGPSQEWVDKANGFMIMDKGCGEPKNDQIVAVNTLSSVGKIEPPPKGQPELRAVITLCDVDLDNKPHTLADVTSNDDPKDFSKLTKSGHLPAPIDNFQALTSWNLANAFLQVNPILLKTLSFPTVAGDAAYSWQAAISFSGDYSLQNANNFVFLELLATLQDFQFRVALDSGDGMDGDNGAYDLGRLLYDATIKSGGPAPRSLAAAPAAINEACPEGDESSEALKGLTCRRFTG